MTMCGHAVFVKDVHLHQRSQIQVFVMLLPVGKLLAADLAQDLAVFVDVKGAVCVVVHLSLIHI